MPASEHMSRFSHTTGDAALRRRRTTSGELILQPGKLVRFAEAGRYLARKQAQWKKYRQTEEKGGGRLADKAIFEGNYRNDAVENDGLEENVVAGAVAPRKRKGHGVRCDPAQGQRPWPASRQFRCTQTAAIANGGRNSNR